MSEVSVLFAVEAEQLLLAGLTKDAIDLCLQGLNVYPDYPAAFSILAKAYKEIGEKDRAEETIGKALNKFPTNRQLAFVSKTITEESKPFVSSKDFDSEFNNFKSESINSSEIIDNFDSHITNLNDNVNIVDTVEDVIVTDDNDINILFEQKNAEPDNNSLSQDLSDIDPNSPDFDINSLMNSSEFEAENTIESLSEPINETESIDNYFNNESVSDNININENDIEDDSLVVSDSANLETNTENLLSIPEPVQDFSFSSFQAQEDEELTGEYEDEADQDFNLNTSNFDFSGFPSETGNILSESEVESKEIENSGLQSISDNIEIEDISEDLQDDITLIPGFLLKLETGVLHSRETNNIKADTLNIIPGLDFSPFNSNYNFRNRISALTALPDIPFNVLAPINDNNTSNQDFSIEELALKLQDAHIPKLDMNAIEVEPEDLTTQNESANIITETIANIYVMQGAIEEAKDAYKQLASQYPDRSDYFFNKADSL